MLGLYRLSPGAHNGVERKGWSVKQLKLQNIPTVALLWFCACAQTTKIVGKKSQTSWRTTANKANTKPQTSQTVVLEWLSGVDDGWDIYHVALMGIMEDYLYICTSNKYSNRPTVGKVWNFNLLRGHFMFWLFFLRTFHVIMSPCCHKLETRRRKEN